MVRADTQTPMKQIRTLSAEYQRWLRENDRTNLAGYSPGRTQDDTPNHRGLVNARLYNGEDYT